MTINVNIGGLGQVSLVPSSPLLGYKAWDSFVSSITSLSDLIYNGDNNRDKMEITINNAIQATDSFLGSIGRDNKIQTQFPYMLLLIIYSWI